MDGGVPSCWCCVMSLASSGLHGEPRTSVRGGPEKSACCCFSPPTEVGGSPGARIGACSRIGAEAPRKAHGASRKPLPARSGSSCSRPRTQDPRLPGAEASSRRRPCRPTPAQTCGSPIAVTSCRVRARVRSTSTGACFPVGAEAPAQNTRRKTFRCGNSMRKAQAASRKPISPRERKLLPRPPPHAPIPSNPHALIPQTPRMKNLGPSSLGWMDVLGRRAIDRPGLLLRLKQRAEGL